MNGFVLSHRAGFPQPEPNKQDTPMNSGDDIPIDPALNEPQVDPALLAEGRSQAQLEVFPPTVPFHQFVFPPPRQYSQGPQGDPFAPQPPPYLPVEEPPPPPTKPLKKKRAPRREEECGFCQGNDAKNKDGMQELMVSCANCGRSAHPTCLDLGEIGNVMHSYPWTCPNCKKCEVCHKEEGDNRMIFCDWCDRGWHLDCLQPPLSEAPPGRWHCPLCPPVPLSFSELQFPPLVAGEAAESTSLLPPPDARMYEQPEHPTKLPPGSGPPYYRENSVASSSRVVDDVLQAINTTTDDSEVDADEVTTPTATRRKIKKSSRPKGKTPMRGHSEATDATRSESARPAKRMRIRLSSPAAPQPSPVIRLRLPARDKGKAREEDPGEAPKGMFDDILSPEDRDTSATSITNADKQRFDRSRAAAEEKLFPRPAPSEIPETTGAGPSTRPLRSTAHHQPPPLTPAPDRSESPAGSTPGPQVQKPDNGLRIRRIRFGDYDIETWYDAPFPEEYANIPDGRLWLCEFCLKYMKSRFVAGRHQLKCKMRHPPGDEIYRDGAISIFEVDGRKNKIYCQNLCLLSKMFLDHKSLFYDVEPFLFYVITEFDDVGARFVGYFSKEKRSPKDYNVSCIMTLPVRQRQGWGQLLIDFSYLLSKKEQRPGSPEKPLSPLGALGYKSYWTFSLMRYFKTAPPNPRLEDISAATAMTVEDIYNTLTQLDMIQVNDSANRPKPLPGQAIRFPKGRKNGVARKHLQRTQTHDDEKVKGPFVTPTKYEIHWDPAKVEAYLAKWEAKNYLTLKPEMLKWSPFIVARTRKTDQLSSEHAGSDQSDVQSHHSAKAEPEETPASNAPATPRPGSSLEARATGAIGTKSPAFSLFDDDNVVNITSFSREPSRVQPDAELVRSPSAIPEPRPQPETEDPKLEPALDAVQTQQEDLEQLERDRAFAQQLAKEELGRRLRSRGQSELTRPPEPRDDPQIVRKARPPAGRRASVRAATNNAVQSNGGSNGDPVEDDAALAAKLAREEGPIRHLRSRSNTEQEVKKAVSTQSSASPRKRRRVESTSPEVEKQKPPPAHPSAPPLTRRGARRTNSGASAAQNPTHQRRKSMRLTNGSALADPHAQPTTIPELDAPEDLFELDGKEEDESDGFGRPETLGGVEDPQTLQQVNGPMTGASTEDTRYEDTDTPLTVVTSDTAFIPEEHTSGMNKASPSGPTVDVAVVVGQGMMQVAEGEEEDAEGEEVGAEDEPDAEGEWDAEGEPDVEGEPDFDVV